MQENFMTKEDFLLFESKDFLPFKSEVKEQFNQIKLELQELRSEQREIRAEMREMKAELQTQMYAVKEELQGQINSLLRWTVGLMTGSAAFISLLMTAFKFLH